MANDYSLYWPRPALSNPVIVDIPPTGGPTTVPGLVGSHLDGLNGWWADLYNGQRDYIIRLPGTIGSPYSGKRTQALTVHGGKNIQIIGGEITTPKITSPGQIGEIGRRCLHFASYPTDAFGAAAVDGRIVHVEGVLCSASGGGSADNMSFADDKAIFQIQNCRANSLRGNQGGINTTTTTSLTLPLNSATVTVASTTGFINSSTAYGGQIMLGGNSGTPATYTSKDATHFFGVTSGGSGSLSSGAQVVQSCAPDGTNSTHADFFQPYGGVKALRVNNFTGSTNNQGLTVRSDLANNGPITLRNVNIKGELDGAWGSGTYYLAVFGPYDTVVLSDVYIQPYPGRRMADSVSPDDTAQNSDWPVFGVAPSPGPGYYYTSYYNNGTQELSFPGTKAGGPDNPNISGIIYDGAPAADFVESGVAGMNYVAPPGGSIPNSDYASKPYKHDGGYYAGAYNTALVQSASLDPNSAQMASDIAADNAALRPRMTSDSAPVFIARLGDPIWTITATGSGGTVTVRAPASLINLTSWGPDNLDKPLEIFDDISSPGSYKEVRCWRVASITQNPNIVTCTNLGVTSYGPASDAFPFLVGNGTGCGLPIAAGLLRIADFYNGKITHAIRAAGPSYIKGTHRFPAATSDQGGDGHRGAGTGYMEMGVRARLKSSVDHTARTCWNPTGQSLTPAQAANRQAWVRMICEALKTYGMIVSDGAEAGTDVWSFQMELDTIYGGTADWQSIFGSNSFGNPYWSWMLRGTTTEGYTGNLSTDGIPWDQFEIVSDGAPQPIVIPPVTPPEPINTSSILSTGKIADDYQRLVIKDPSLLAYWIFDNPSSYAFLDVKNSIRYETSGTPPSPSKSILRKGTKARSIIFPRKESYFTINSSKLNATNNISVEAWILANSTFRPNSQMYIYYHNDNTRLYEQGNVLSFQVKAQTAASTYQTFTANYTCTNSEEDRSHHIVGTYDKKDVRLYLNGILKAQVGATSSNLFLDKISYTSVINYNSATTFNNYFLISDLAVYSEALPPGKIKRLYDYGRDVKRAAKITSWRSLDGKSQI